MPSLLPVVTEHHVERNEQKERPEYLPQDMPFDLRGYDGTDRGAEEEPQRKKPGDGKVDVASTIVAKRRQEPDRWQQDRQ